MKYYRAAFPKSGLLEQAVSRGGLGGLRLALRARKAAADRYATARNRRDTLLALCGTEAAHAVVHLLRAKPDLAEVRRSIREAAQALKGGQRERKC